MTKIACVGDSITWGFTIIRRLRYSYPAQLGHLLGKGYRVRNFGVNNACASFHSDLPYGLTPSFRAALRYKPDVVVMMLGTNDSKKFNWNPENFRSGYLKILERFLDMPQKPRVYLMVPPHIFSSFGPEPFALSNERLEEQVIPAIREIASSKSLPLIDLHTAIAEKSLLNDGVHPGRAGAAVIALEVYKEFSLEHSVRD